MDIFSNHIFDWLVLLALILAAIYTMKIIGAEKSTFREECFHVQFGPLQLLIPKWWSITVQDKGVIKFERTDTHYDWYSLFEYFPEHQQKSLPQILEEKLNLDKIEFDHDVVFETDSRVLFRDPEIQKHFQEVIRVEGMASQDVIERIYCDIYLMRGLGDEGYFVFENRSSVLSGSVEGPYFEESLSCLSFIHESQTTKT